MSALRPESGISRAARYAVPFVLLLIPLWMIKVNIVVPEPYLDEVFHVPQAQAYWDHKWFHWDPKITTPPGLYIWSYVLCAGALALRGSPTELNAEALRATNAVAAGAFLPWRLQTLLDALRKVQNTRPSGARLSHTVLNICLFPPLFFFSGLYYTDIVSLLVVIEAYNWDVKRTAQSGLSPLQTLVFVVVGLAALVLRQTNIFWVSVFLGGLQVVRRLRQTSKVCDLSASAGIVQSGLNGELYDPLVSEASFSDYYKTAVSLACVCLKNIAPVVFSILPYLVILVAFGGFVLWNNGVVLGHKEFHTAGLHLSQMLYIWPYFMFFSWPILVFPVLNLVIPRSVIPAFLDYGFTEKQRGLPRILTALVVLPVMLAVVHFNTIIHPFTLADNRHYVFYVFRILSSHPAIRYAAVLVYFVCGWAAISAFGFSTAKPLPQYVPISKPQELPAARKGQLKETSKKPKSERKAKLKKGNQATTSPSTPQQFSPEVLARIQEHLVQRQKQQQEVPRVSFVLVWLAATALSLVTAPLVEPRYFIIPWVMWRLHLPPQPTPLVYRQQRPRDEREALHASLATNFSLFMETYWFLAVNAATGYIFLYKGFEWPQEPGKIQRFMW